MENESISELKKLNKILDGIQDRILVLANDEIQKEDHSLITFSELDSIHVVLEDVQKRISKIIV